jgi:4-hydroxy-4-methyl-2-oxoglutarate aldolase
VNVDELIERFAKLSSCQVSDGMGALGLSRAALPGITAMDPADAIAGPAFTVSYLPAEEAGSRKVEYLGKVRPGEVLVLAHGGRTDCSVWGGQRSIGAIQAGAVGTVVDGAYRDVREHRQLRYPVFGTKPTVVSGGPFVSPVASGETVEVAGVTVSPGDIVVADASGVVVVPSDRALEVLEAAEATARQEAEVAEAVASGADFTTFRARVRGEA